MDSSRVLALVREGGLWRCLARRAPDQLLADAWGSWRCFARWALGVSAGPMAFLHVIISAFCFMTSV
eukprot:881828-Lingulodinium_polyedra.AAC.2